MRNKPLPSKERLEELLDYNPNTGEFRWKVTRGGKAKAGDKAGSVKKIGYVSISIDDIPYTAHRIAFYLMTGKQPPEVDHKNGIRNDNRINNLRGANKKLNCHNSAKRSDNTSGIIGVCYNKTRMQWEASFGSRKHQKQHKTRRFLKTFEEAVAQRKIWEDQYGMTELKKHRENA